MPSESQELQLPRLPGLRERAGAIASTWDIGNRREKATSSHKKMGRLADDHDEFRAPLSAGRCECRKDSELTGFL